ncbi:MAG: cephalosporin hydroxylase family protein [Thermoleophilaceae bacterium]
MSDLPRPSAADFEPILRVATPAGEREVDIYSKDGFDVLSQLWTRSNWHNKLSYEVTWLGIPIIQLPEDMVVMQELIWKVRPDVIVESGVAHGGALVLYASIMELLGRGRVIGVDVEIRKYNRLAIEAHPLSHRIQLIEGDSLADETVAAVRSRIRPGERVMVALDSNHTREHVRGELQRYAPLVTPNSYLVVFDAVMALVADAPSAGDGWDHDNPLEAVREFVDERDDFEVDRSYERLAVTYCQGGFLRRTEAD